jgi:hypothetical protein
MDFIDKIIQVEDEAKAFILTKIKKGETLNLMAIAENEIYELPRVLWVGKYDIANEYAIVGLHHNKFGELVLKGRGIAEVEGEEKDFTRADVITGFISDLADFIS